MLPGDFRELARRELNTLQLLVLVLPFLFSVSTAGLYFLTSNNLSFTYYLQHNNEYIF